MIFSVSTLMAQTTQWRDIHKVKRHETIFGIAKDYGVTIEDLLNANPEMKQAGYELKKGTWIFVPFGKNGDKKSPANAATTPANAAAKATGSTPATAQQSVPAAMSSVRVGIMLPLHNNDGDGKRMVEYYRGMLMAFNDLKAQGINTEVHAWNVPKDADIRTTLLDNSAANLDIIFGPLYSNMVKPLGDFCRQHGIKLVIPFSITGNDVSANSNIFQVYQEPSELNSKTLGAFLERFQKDGQPIFVNCNDAGSDKGSCTSALRQALDASKVAYKLSNVNTPLAQFAKAFSPTKTNVIVLNTARSPQLNRVFSKLDSLKAIRPELKISMFGYNEWLMYQKYDLDNFFKYNVYIPTTYYYNAASDKTQSLEKQYLAQFGTQMMEEWLPRMALTGYDQGMYFITGMSQYGKAFSGTESQSSYRPQQTRLVFKKTGASGGYINNNFQLIHFKSDRTMESLTY